MQRKQYSKDQMRAITREFETAGIYPGMQSRSAARAAAEEGEGDGIRWILTSEQPATVWDWNRWDFVQEVLLMDGMQVPANGQVPFLDSHSRKSVDDLMGSVSDFQRVDLEKFASYDGLVNFAADEKSQRTRQKALDGHLTDGSVGYEVTGSVWIPEGEEASVRGRIFKGPLKVSYEWNLKEFSGTPIGADTLAKVRAICAGGACRMV